MNEYDNLSDEEIDARLASIDGKLASFDASAGGEPVARPEAPFQDEQPKPIDEMSDEELDARLSQIDTQLGLRQQQPVQPAPRTFTREERIAQNNAAIARAQQPGEGEGGSFGEAVIEGLRGAGRAAKAIGKGFVGLASGAARLAGTPVRAVSGWDGLHRLADSIDSGYDNWGADTLASEYGFDQDTNIGTVGEKIAGLSGTLGSLALGGGVANATKLPMAVRAGGVALQKSLPWMFGNDAAVRTYDTAKQTAEANGEEFNRARALGLASVNGAIHYLGFKLFENQSLNRMLGMPQAAELAMPGFANTAREGGAKTFSGIVDGVRNGLIKHVVAERAKGALKAGGIMGVQNFLSSLPQQAAEGRDIDWYEALKAGAEGVEEGAFMEGLMGGAAVLRSKAAARKFTADKYFRDGYRASNGEHVPGLLHTKEGREFIMKQSPAEQARILDIVSHGGKVSKAELDAACLPPDMKPDELKEFAKDWRKDLADEWDRAAEPEAIGDNEELEGNDDVIPREQQMRNRAKVNEARDHERRLAEAEEDAQMVAAEEAKYSEANARADAERQAEADGAEQLAREEEYRRTEAPQDAVGTRGAEGAADVPSVPSDAPQGAEAALEGAQTEPPPTEVVDRPNRLRRQQPNNFRHPGDNRLRPAVPDINQQPIRETNDETGNGADEAPAQPVAQVSGRDGRQPPPEAGARPLEGAAARAEAPDTGVVEPISAKKMRTMNYENVIALPDSWQKYSELQSRFMRTGDKGGISVESPAGKQIKAELERMDADGWGDLYRAKMKWAGADRKIRGEQPPNTLEAFKKWQATKSSAPTVPTEQKSEPQTAEKLRDAMKGDNVLKKIDAAYKKAKTDAERNALKERFATRVAELRKQLEKAAETNRLRNAAGEDPLAARGQPARKDGSATAAQSAGKMADRFLSLVDKIADERKRGIEAERKVKTDDEFSHLYDANWKRQQAGLDALKAEIDALSADELSALSDALYSRASGFPGSRERAELRQQLREYVVNAWRENSNAASAENVSPQATSKNDAAPSNSDVAARATWTDRGGTTHVLDGFNAPSSDNMAKGAHVAVRHDNGVLYQGEIVGIGPKNVKVKTGGGMGGGEVVLTFPRKDIVGVRSQAGQVQQNTERVEGNDVAALTAKAQALAKEYAELPDVEKVSAEGRDLEQRIAEAWDAVDAAERAENAPVTAPKKTGATTPPEAAKPAEGGKSASGATPAAPTPEMRRKATAAMRILGADAGKDAAALEAELSRMEARGQAASGPGRRRAEALRDLAAYKRAVGTKEVSAEEIAEGRQRDAEQRIIEGEGDTLPSEGFYGRRQSRGNGGMLAKWTDAAKKPLERVARALRNVVTVGGKKLKVSFADRPADVNGQTRKSIGGIFTGTASDYANESRQGGVGDGPSLQKIGTGEGSQVYGWGLYGSNERGVAERYAKNGRGAGGKDWIKEGKNHDEMEGVEQEAASYLKGMGSKESAIKRLKEDVEDFAEKGWTEESETLKPVLEELLKNGDKYREQHENVYEQTFFTNRAPGDESHLLKWYEDLPKEQVDWIAQEFAKEGFFVASFSKLKGWTVLDRASGKKLSIWDKRESGETYEAVARFLGSPQAASEFLVRAGIDGVRYPVDSYGKTVKDGDEAGWNYVSFRDDNIRVDHKWTDGQMRYMRNGDGEVVGEYDADNGEIRLYPGATVADVVHEFTHPLVDFARAEAEAGRGELLGKIREIIDAERATWEQPVREAYADKGEGEILEEIFTHAMGDKGATLFGKSTTTLEGRRWYNRLWDAIKGLWQDFATKMGWNRADLRGLDEMSPEAAAQKILSEMAKGRSFGDATTGGEGARNAVRNVPPAPTNQDIQDYLGGKDGFMRRLRRMFQDKNIVIRDAEERLGVTDKDASTYYAKDRAFGKNEHELTVLQKREVEPIVEKIHKSGGSLELFSAYLYARHSGERNAALKASRGVENGSGMTADQADTIFRTVDRLGLRAAFEDAARDVWAMNRKYLQRRVDSGRMTQADYDFYTQKYKHYVPLRTDMTDEELDIFNSTTGGWKRNELMTAKGRKSTADDPLAFSIVQNEQAIRASNANEVRRRFAGLVRKSKGALGEVVDGVNKGGAKWSFTFGDGETVETGSPMRLASERDDIVLFKENGQLKAVKVNPGEHGRGLDLARAVTDKDVVQFNRHLEWIPRATRWMSAMRTQYVPTFIVRNMKADNLEVMLNALSERGMKDGAKFFGKFLKNEVSVAKGVKEYFKTGKSSDRFVQEAVENGLLTGGGMSAEGFTETARRLSDTLQALRERPKILGGAFEAAKDTISLLNACAEYNTRMGVYKTLREEGMSVADAVSYARDVTVNFNRKGYLTPYTNAAFMFSNAAIQGMGRAFKSMKSEHGKEVLAGMFLVGVAQALLDDWLGHDDESEKSGGADSRNLTEYDKSHSLGVALPTGHRVKTGIRNPWALPMYAGRKAVELLKGISSGEKVMKDLASEVGQFVTEPVGGNGFDSTSEFLQTLAPTIIDPFVQWGTGKDYRGQDRLKKSFDKYAPDSWNGKDSTPEAYKAIAKALNFISGGSEHRKGAFDVAPENVRLLTETVFGGVLTDLNNLVKGGEHAVDAVRGKPAAQIARDIPFVRDTFTNMPDNTSRFYAAIDAYNADKAELKKTTELGRRRDMKREKPYLTQGNGRVDGLIERVKELRHLERGEVKAGQKWVERKTPVPEERKRRFREQRLATQARVLKMLGE